MCRLSVSSVAVMLGIAAIPGLSTRPCAAAIDPVPSFDRLADVWMGAVAFLAHDGGREPGGGEHAVDWRREHGDRDHEHGGRGRTGGHERCDCDGEGCDRCSPAREHGHRGHGADGGHGWPHRDHGPGPRPGREGPHVVLAKMDEILARLARIEARLDGRAGGPPRGEWPGARPPWGGPGPGPRPEMPEEAREQLRKRMEQARQKFREMEERIKVLEAQIEQLKSDR